MQEERKGERHGGKEPMESRKRKEGSEVRITGIVEWRERGGRNDGRKRRGEGVEGEGRDGLGG